MVNPNAYTPKSVSIGPFHHGLQESTGVKMQKLKYLKKFCLRTRKSQKDLASIIEKKEEKIRGYYSETFKLISNKKFVEIILLDGIFIIELLWRNFKRQINPGKYGNDYILSNPWLESHIKQDLILLENQLPFKILQKLYEFAFDKEEVPPFLELACQFFFEDKPYRPIEKEVKHFTDLKRMFYSPSNPKPGPKSLKHLRYTATKLYETGLEFKALEHIDYSQNSLLDIELAKGKHLERHPCLNLSWLFSCLPCLKLCQCSNNVRCILKVPQLIIDDKTEALFRNLMALEQCHYPLDTYICHYVLLMDYLITTKDDVRLLVEKKVIVNRRGSNKEVTTLINKLGHEIVESESCYHELYKQLDDHCGSTWNSLVASLTSVYFKDFWRGTATIAGIFVLGVTFVNFLRPFVMKN